MSLLTYKPQGGHECVRPPGDSRSLQHLDKVALAKARVPFPDKRRDNGEANHFCAVHTTRSTVTGMQHG
eukprot:8483918-Alexandrium_andersonii.AAC.1